MPQPNSISNQFAPDDVVNQQVADMQVLLRIMTGSNAHEALGALRAGLARTTADPLDDIGVIGRRP